MNSLRSNIYFGFTVIVTLLAAIGVIGYSGVSRLYESSAAMQQASAVSLVVQEIDRDVQELQLRVSRYMATGHNSLRRDIVQLNDRLVSRINEQATNQENKEMRDMFVRMSQHLPEYKKHFDSVIEERGLRADLVQQQLPDQSAIVHQHLRELNDILPADETHIGAHAKVLRCETQFSQAEKSLLRYYVAADSKIFNEALQFNSEAIECLAQLDATGEAETLRTSLMRELTEYERIGTRAVQATRSYLFLVNVVMAGEASEVTYFSDRLKTLAQESSEKISSEMATTVAKVQQITKIGIVLAVVLGLLFAGRLGRSILQPVTSITETFRQLASGRTAVTIPETQRNDEIGQMALAAEVFRQRNVEQEQLLKMSESLSKELAAKAEELEATNADLDNFAYVASHDLKSPLRGIRQLAAWIEEDSGHLLPEESVQHFRKMQQRVQRMEMLLDDLLDFSRIGRVEAASEAVDVGKVIKSIVDITNNPHNVQINIPDSLPTLETIRVPCEQVLLNLISNAIKHNDKQDQGVIEVVWDRSGENEVFTVSDNGPGISEEHHERVFQMYQRVGDPAVEGSGMGLAIVKKQVERMGGNIRLGSNTTGGVTFTVAWPAKRIETGNIKHV